MIYQTRHLEALGDIPLGQAYHVKGDRFHATEIDANYLVRARKAKDVEDVTHIPVAAPSAQPQVPVAAPAPTEVKPDATVVAAPAAGGDGALNTADAEGPKEQGDTTESAAPAGPAVPAADQAAGQDGAAVTPLSTADTATAATEQPKAPVRHNAVTRNTRSSAAGK